MPALIPVDDTLGAAFIGNIVSGVLYGITCLQAYIYYTETSRDDRLPLRVFVATLIGIETLHLSLISHIVYAYTVTNFGDYQSLTQMVWSYSAEVCLVNLISLLINGFFSWRIYILSNRTNRLLPAIIMFSTAWELVGTTGFVVIGTRDTSFSEAGNLIPWASVALALSLVSDGLIASGMIYYLWNSRIRGFTGTNRGIHTLIIYTVNTGLLTTIFSALTLATFVTLERTMIYGPFFFVFARLKGCAFMSTLNSRKTVRAMFDETRRTRGAGTTTRAQDVVALSDLHMASIVTASPRQSNSGYEGGTSMSKAETQSVV